MASQVKPWQANIAHIMRSFDGDASVVFEIVFAW
jgi:hypothetical protein